MPLVLGKTLAPRNKSRIPNTNPFFLFCISSFNPHIDFSKNSYAVV
jgi:hypothetical protein